MSRPPLWLVVVDAYGEATVKLKAEITKALPGHLTFRTREHAERVAEKVNADPEVKP